jgi:hypothetical protein
MASSGVWRGKKGARPTHWHGFMSSSVLYIRKCNIFSPVWQESLVLVIPIVNRIVVGATNSPRFWE